MIFFFFFGKQAEESNKTNRNQFVGCYKEIKKKDCQYVLGEREINWISIQLHVWRVLSQKRHPPSDKEDSFPGRSNNIFFFLNNYN